jgi:hypothetical protein
MSYWVNSILFPLGIVAVVWFAWPIAQGLRRAAAGNLVVPPELRLARQRSIFLGHWIAAVGLVLWLIAGIAFPVGIDRIAGIPPGGYLHFLLSMFTCGVISCCFPFLATTWLTLRVFLPALLASAAPEAGEQRRLTALSRHATVYLGMTVVVPLLGLLLAIWGGRDVREYTTILIVASGLGFLAAWFMHQRIRTDLAALSVATRPGERFGASTELVETL